MVYGVQQYNKFAVKLPTANQKIQFSQENIQKET